MRDEPLWTRDSGTLDEGRWTTCKMTDSTRVDRTSVQVNVGVGRLRVIAAPGAWTRPQKRLRRDRAPWRGRLQQKHTCNFRPVLARMASPSCMLTPVKMASSGKSPVGSDPAAPSADTSDKLIAAAERLFAEYGYTNVSVR